MPKQEPFDWDDLRFFLHAAQEKTLAGAARSLGVEHTTIGRRLSALEKQLGAPLMIRGPSGLQLTPLGVRALPLVEQVERAVAEVRSLVNEERNRVRLAVPSGMTALFTGGLDRLRQAHPRLQLELVSGAKPVDLKKGEADLAIRIGEVTDPDLVAQRVGDSGTALYGSAAYLARKPPGSEPSDLTGHDVIGFDSALASVPAAKWIDERAAKATIVLRSREMTDMISACVSGLGLAVLPCVMGDAEPSLRRLTREVITSRPMWLVSLKEAKKSEPIRAVSRFAVEVMREHAGKLAGEPLSAHWRKLI